MPGPRAAQNLQMPHPRNWQGEQMPCSSPGGEGGWAQLELTDALSAFLFLCLYNCLVTHIAFFYSNSLQNPKIGMCN